MTAYGYIRQSRRADLDVALSPDQQRRDIATLAARDGETVAAVFEDLGRSGGKGKERLRAGYQDLLNAIGSGAASVIYTKTLTRLGRSVRELYRVLELAETHGCRISTMKEGVIDPRSPIGRAQFGMLAVFAEFERDLAVERARDNVASRRAAGVPMGRRTYGTAPGEDPSVIVEAFRAAGSYNGAALALNAASVPTMLGRKWSPTSVRLVVKREAAHLVPAHPRRGARTAASVPLNGLLRCACKATLTGTTSHAGKYVRYHCHNGATSPTHGPKSVSQSVALPYVQERVDRALDRLEEMEGNAVLTAHERDADRAALEAERERLVLLFTKNKIDEETFDRLAADVDDRLEATEEQTTIIDLPRIDWTWPPADINRLLRRLIDHVELGPDLRPVDVHWRGKVAEWAA
jgi:DNA invertase Pin-like site-specific DNA recombinase